MFTEEVFPLFKTAYSFKSIMQLKSCDKKQNNASIVDVVKKHKIKSFALVEDNMTAFKEARDLLADYDYYFGIRFDIKTACAEKDFTSKIVVFMPDMGEKSVENMVKFSSLINNKPENERYIDEGDLNGFEGSFVFMVPFYDSFLQKNIEQFNLHSLPAYIEKPFFAIEDNDVVYDKKLAEIVENFCNVSGYETTKTKTIYYEYDSDIVAYSAYRCITGRGGPSYRAPDLTNPNLEDFSSNQFSVESFLKTRKNK